MVDDYGHHPAEIRATIEAAAARLSGEDNRDHRRFPAAPAHAHARPLRRVHARLQSGRRPPLTDIYAAGEIAHSGHLFAEKLLQAIREHGHHDAAYVHDKTDLPEVLERIGCAPATW